MSRRLLPLLLLVPAAGSAAAAAPAPPVLHHVADVVLDTAAHTVTVHDRLTLPPGVAELRFGPQVAVQDLTIGGRTLQPVPVADDEGERQVVDLAAAGLDQGGEADVHLTGTFHQPTDQVTFSRENVGGEIDATVGDEGVYLSAGAGWLPSAPGALNTYDLTVRVPEGYASVTQGRREVLSPNVTRWVAEHPSDGLNLVANRFIVNEEPVRDGVIAYTFLLEDDADLRATYLERTRAYIAMYEEMFGPYPYAKFATVENWFPTGYGMPSWTLLGGQVLRLPFIPTTSFGHEIAHDWWGNSVFVDVYRGNWCEGLTVWSADYHYKELESPEAAREYRRNLLKDYYAYVKDPAADFPLRSFAVAPQRGHPRRGLRQEHDDLPHAGPAPGPGEVPGGPAQRLPGLPVPPGLLGRLPGGVRRPGRPRSPGLRGPVAGPRRRPGAGPGQGGVRRRQGDLRAAAGRPGVRPAGAGARGDRGRPRGPGGAPGRARGHVHDQGRGAAAPGRRPRRRRVPPAASPGGGAHGQPGAGGGRAQRPVRRRGPGGRRTQLRRGFHRRAVLQLPGRRAAGRGTCRRAPTRATSPSTPHPTWRPCTATPS